MKPGDQHRQGPIAKETEAKETIIAKETEAKDRSPRDRSRSPKPIK